MAPRKAATQRSRSASELRCDAIRLVVLLVRPLELAEDPRCQARCDQRAGAPERRGARGVRVEERGGVLPGADVLAADVPVEVEVAAQLHARPRTQPRRRPRGRQERVERGLEVGLLGDAALERSDLIDALDAVADLPGDRRVPVRVPERDLSRLA